MAAIRLVSVHKSTRSRLSFRSNPPGIASPKHGSRCFTVTRSEVFHEPIATPKVPPFPPEALKPLSGIAYNLRWSLGRRWLPGQARLRRRSRNWCSGRAASHQLQAVMLALASPIPFVGGSDECLERGHRCRDYNPTECLGLSRFIKGIARNLTRIC